MQKFLSLAGLIPVLLIALSASFLAAARTADPADSWPTSGWKTSSPESQGMDSGELAKVLDYILGKDANVHSLLVIKNGYLVMDAYFYPFSGPGRLHDVASVTKSITATLIGAALEAGLIKDIRQPALGFFADRETVHPSAWKNAITLEDLLTMRSGLTCINRPVEVTLFQMMGSPDWVQFMLDQPMAAKPGTEFVYSSGAVHLLSAVIRRASGKSALDFARESLLGPLGISEVIWPASPQGDSCGWGNLRLLPHDMAKIAYLYLKDGVWEGKRILPSWWVKEATKKRVVVDEDKGYGYLWWVQSPGTFNASGRGGQSVFVVPGRDLIAVMTGGGTSVSPVKIVDEFLIPAIKKTKGTLPANPEGAALLESKIRRAAASPNLTPEPVNALPAIAKAISGKTFVLEPNAFGLLSMTLTFVSENEATLKIDIALDTDRSPEYRLGLDDIARAAPGRFGLPAEGKGLWMPDGAFFISVDEVGNISKYRVRLTFEGDGLTGEIDEMTGLGSAVIRGKTKGS